MLSVHLGVSFKPHRARTLVSISDTDSMFAGGSEHRQPSSRDSLDVSTEPRPPKRARNHDAPNSSLDASAAPDQPFTSTPRKTHSKKQPLSCAECRRCVLIYMALNL